MAIRFDDQYPQRIFLYDYWARDGSLSWAVRLKQEPNLLDGHLPGYRLKERDERQLNPLVPSSTKGDVVKGKVWDCESWHDLFLFWRRVAYGRRVKPEPVEIIINNSPSPIQTYVFVLDEDWAYSDHDPVKPQDTDAEFPEIRPPVLVQKKTPFFFHDPILQDVLNYLGPLKYPSRVAHVVGYKPTTSGSRHGLAMPPIPKGHRVDTKIRTKGKVCELIRVEREKLEQYTEGVFAIKWLFIEVEGEEEKAYVAGCLVCRDDEQDVQEIDQAVVPH